MIAWFDARGGSRENLVTASVVINEMLVASLDNCMDVWYLSLLIRFQPWLIPTLTKELQDVVPSCFVSGYNIVLIDDILEGPSR